MNSIRRKVTWLIIALIVLITFSATLTGYRSSMKDATRLFDGELKAIANTLMVLPAPNTVLEINSPADVAWQVFHDGKLAMRSVNAPDDPISNNADGYTAENFLGNRWRVLVNRSKQADLTVIVAHPLYSRNVLAENLILSSMTPMIASIPFLAALIYLVVSRGLYPLKALSKQLNGKQRNNLEPIVLSNTPSELTTVISTLNSLFKRLDKAFEREQLFSANAAHELRTPLSVLKINLHNLRQSDNVSEADIEQCQNDTNRMIHVVNQLLMLSRTNPETMQAEMEPMDLESVAQHVISECYEKIDNKQQSVSLISEPCQIEANRFALQTLLTNLVENASKYSPPKGDIEITIHKKQHLVTLIVADSGPGIPATSRDKVLTPFYRLTDANTRKQTGSGLGLAIVNQIVTLHHGTMRLGESSFGGLLITVELPATLEARI